MTRAHQPGSEPIDIPEVIPNPVVLPEQTPTPSAPAPPKPVKTPVKVPADYAAHTAARISREILGWRKSSRPTTTVCSSPLAECHTHFDASKTLWRSAAPGATFRPVCPARALHSQ